MDKIFWLLPQKLAGRSGPNQDPWNLKAIRESGIDVIVSLDSDCDAASISKSGIKHLQHFIPPVCPVTPALMLEFAHIAHRASKEVIQCMSAGSKVMVHCMAGKDRTGLVLCASLIHLEGLNAKQALERVRLVRPIALTAPGMIEALWEYENLLRAGALD